MHQIRFQPGFRPRLRWGSLQRSPYPLAGIKGPLRGREGEKKGRKGMRRDGKGGEGIGGAKGRKGKRRIILFTIN